MTVARSKLREQMGANAIEAQKRPIETPRLILQPNRGIAASASGTKRTSKP